MIQNNGEFFSGRIANDEHKSVEILHQFTKSFCIDVNVNRLVTNGFHGLRVAITWIIIQVKGKHSVLQRASSQNYSFTF